MPTLEELSKNQLIGRLIFLKNLEKKYPDLYRQLEEQVFPVKQEKALLFVYETLFTMVKEDLKGKIDESFLEKNKDFIVHYVKYVQFDSSKLIYTGIVNSYEAAMAELYDILVSVQEKSEEKEPLNSQLPSIRLPFKIGNKHFVIERLDRNDPRGYALGAFVPCCQRPTRSGVGPAYCKAGMNHERAGFFVVKKIVDDEKNSIEGRIVAQTFAFISENPRSLVFGRWTYLQHEISELNLIRVIAELINKVQRDSAVQFSRILSGNFETPAKTVLNITAYLDNPNNIDEKLNADLIDRDGREIIRLVSDWRYQVSLRDQGELNLRAPVDHDVEFGSIEQALSESSQEQKPSRSKRHSLFQKNNEPDSSQNNPEPGTDYKHD